MRGPHSTGGDSRGGRLGRGLGLERSADTCLHRPDRAAEARDPTFGGPASLSKGSPRDGGGASALDQRLRDDGPRGGPPRGVVGGERGRGISGTRRQGQVVGRALLAPPEAPRRGGRDTAPSGSPPSDGGDPGMSVCPPLLRPRTRTSGRQGQPVVPFRLLTQLACSRPHRSAVSQPDVSGVCWLRALPTGVSLVGGVGPAVSQSRRAHPFNSHPRTRASYSAAGRVCLEDPDGTFHPPPPPHPVKRSRATWETFFLSLGIVWRGRRGVNWRGEFRPLGW